MAADIALVGMREYIANAKDIEVGEQIGTGAFSTGKN